MLGQILGSHCNYQGLHHKLKKCISKLCHWQQPNRRTLYFPNLGNLYRQQKQYQFAKAMFSKSLELQPGYAPAYNNLGLIFVVEGRWEEANYCFNKAIQADPLLDVAKSNMIKAVAMCRVCTSSASCLLQD